MIKKPDRINTCLHENLIDRTLCVCVYIVTWLRSQFDLKKSFLVCFRVSLEVLKKNQHFMRKLGVPDDESTRIWIHVQNKSDS